MAYNRNLSFVAGALLLAAPAWAQNLDRGIEAYERRDCVDAEQELRPLAEAGDAGAQLYLGKAHEYCWGIPSLPLADAAKWYRRAAEQGNAEAQFWLGMLYVGGRGVTKDMAEAKSWWNRSAELGNVDAMIALADISYACQTEGGFYCGLPDPLRPVHPDFKEAAKWYGLAAERGSFSAQMQIGAMHEEGLGVLQDFALAHMWYNLAAAQVGGGSWSPNVAVTARDAIAAKMSPDQIAEAQRLARVWKPKGGPLDAGEAPK